MHTHRRRPSTWPRCLRGASVKDGPRVIGKRGVLPMTGPVMYLTVAHLSMFSHQAIRRSL
jgi:hypothetical protein